MKCHHSLCLQGYIRCCPFTLSLPFTLPLFKTSHTCTPLAKKRKKKKKHKTLAPALLFINTFSASGILPGFAGNCLVGRNFRWMDPIVNIAFPHSHILSSTCTLYPECFCEFTACSFHPYVIQAHKFPLHTCGGIL